MEPISWEREMKELESMFLQMLLQNGIWAWEYDIEHRQIIRYPFLTKSDPYGYDEEVIANVPDSIIARGTIYEEDVPKYLELHRRISDGENQVSVQVRVWVVEKQEYVWQQMTATLVRDCNGKPVRALCSSRDISESKEMEQRFLEESSHWEEISSSMLATGRWNLTTRKWEKVTIHGMSISLPEEIEQSNDYRTRVGYFLFQVALSDEDAEKLTPEYLIHQYSGGVRNTSCEYNARTMEQGEPVRVKMDCHVLKRPETGDLIAFFYESDITQEFCVRSIMNSIIDYEYDLVGVLFAESKAIYSRGKEYKTALPELKSNNYDEACQKFLGDCGCSENLDEMIKTMQLEHILKELEQRDTYSVEFSMCEPSGEIRRKEMRYSYISREEQLIAVLRRDVQDIVNEEQAKKKQLEEALNLAEQANSAKSEFLSRMSHEMRTPMNAIVGLVALAGQELDNPQAIGDYLNKIQVSGRILLNHINDVLDMAKIESGNMELHQESCCFSVLMDGIKSVITPLCEQKGIHFVEEGQECTEFILVDRLRFQQVIINLLSNAIKFTPEEGNIYFRYKGRCEGNTLFAEVEVADNGIGMSEEFQKKMFRPFTQEQRAGEQFVQGTGLGLAITKAIIDKMGGTIQVDSHLGAGTRFLIQIGFLLVEEAENVQQEESMCQSRMEENLQGRHVLLVEDHPMNQMIARRILQNNGLEVVTVDNGEQAVEIFRKREADEFDAVLMDIRMPIMDGITATKLIRQMPYDKARQIPIIAMTANAFEEDMQKTKEAGMDYHLTKPIEPILLLKTLEERICGKQ